MSGITQSIGAAIYSAAVAPADVDLPGGPCNNLYVGGAGDVHLVAQDGSQAVYVNHPAGQDLPVRAKRVLPATTATNIVAET